MFQTRNKQWTEWAAVPLRIIIGFGFMAHGWAKLSRGPEGFAKLLGILGVPLPHIASWLTTFVELLGGFAIFIGFCVELVSIPLIIVMLVAMFTVHVQYGFSSIKTVGLTNTGPKFGPPGVEVNLLYIASLINLILIGAGRFSVYNFIKREKTKPDHL